MAEREGPVEDGEHIYRSVRNDVDHYVIIDGMLRLCSPAFNDQKLQPSVDRAVFRANPADTRLHPDDGVVRLVVSAVRGVGRNTRTQGLRCNTNRMWWPIQLDPMTTWAGTKTTHTR